MESAVLAGVYLCDVFNTIQYHPFRRNWEKANIMLAVNDYMDLEQPPWKDVPGNLHGLLYPEKVYSLSKGNFFVTPLGTFYNIDILNREGIPDIHEYMARGEWNWDNFLDIAKVTTRDINGDGVVEQWGVLGPDVASIATAIIYSNGGSIVGKDTGGSFSYTLQSARSLKAMQFFSDLFNVYKVSRPSIYSSQTFFQNGFGAMYIDYGWRGKNFKPWGMNLGYEEFPCGPDHDGRTVIQPDGGGQSFFFPATLTDPEAVIHAVAYWHAIWDESKSEHVSLDTAMLDSSVINMFRQSDIDAFVAINRKNVAFDYYNYFDTVIARVTSDVFNKAYGSSTTAASAIASLQPFVESVISNQLSK